LEVLQAVDKMAVDKIAKNSYGFYITVSEARQFNGNTVKTYGVNSNAIWRSSTGNGYISGWR
jgi:hypothetical protein